MRLKKTLPFLAICLISLTLQAKEVKYPVSAIPDSLKTNAFSVIRSSELVFEVVSLTETKIEEHLAITVLNENGKRDAWENISYDLSKKVEKLDVRMYNADGVLIDKWSKKDLDDVSYDNYGTAYSDTRSLISKPVNNTYPYTVDYYVVYRRNNTYICDGWFPVWGDNISIQRSAFTVKFPSDIKIKYKEYNLTDKFVKAKNNSQVTWELKNFMAIKQEPYRPTYRSTIPFVDIGVNNFSYGGFQGSINSWKNFGLFIKELNKDKDELPESRKADIDKIIENDTSDSDRIRDLYKYMQSHTRYVNITIGIGGIQPFSAKTVSENGYGDCKALSNYMKAILKYAGIKSYYTLVNAGTYNYYFDTDFVSHQFNHAILCVPLAKDTIWLECTSQTIPCGFLGNFTDNRNVLLITEEGGVIAKTPLYSKEDNKIVRCAKVVLDESGDCTAELHSTYTGLEYNDKHSLIVEDKEQQKKMLYADFSIPNFQISNFELQTKGGKFPVLDEHIELNLPSYASKSGSRMFVPLNLASKMGRVPEKVVDRKFDVYKNSTYCGYDTIQYTIPENYVVEVLPEAKSIACPYGKYSFETKMEGKKIVYIRYYDVNKGVFPASEYNDFRDFFAEVKKNDGAMVVLKKGE